MGVFVGVRGSAVGILEWAKERGTRFYSLSVTGDDALILKCRLQKVTLKPEACKN